MATENKGASVQGTPSSARVQQALALLEMLENEGFPTNPEDLKSLIASKGALMELIV